jgi:hypothetical protein
MRIRLLRVGLFAGVLLSGVACRSTAGANISRGNDDSNDLHKQLATNSKTVDLSTFTLKFPWDRMYIFQPYSPKDEICAKLGLNAERCGAADVRDVDEGEFLLVFMQQDELTHIEYIPRFVEFEESERCLARPIKRAAATFSVERRDRSVLHCQL